MVYLWSAYAQLDFPLPPLHRISMKLPAHICWMKYIHHFQDYIHSETLSLFHSCHVKDFSWSNEHVLLDTDISVSFLPYLHNEPTVGLCGNTV
jgi:hypothetical protein